MMNYFFFASPKDGNMCEKYEEVGNGSIRMSVSELSPFLRPHQQFQGESFRDEKNHPEDKSKECRVFGGGDWLAARRTAVRGL